MQHTIILTPLYNDETCFLIFAKAVENEVKNNVGHSFSFLVVNDGTDHLQLSSNLPITVVHLYRNLGHQKAIAIGLSYAHHHLAYDNILVMDCDGEDRPEDIRTLLSSNPDKKIIVAKRARRQESWIFKTCYYIYKTVFYVLTGRRISFGNFMLFPKQQVEKIVHFNEIWNNLAGTILKSKIPFNVVATNRGKRYEGNTKMNFTALLLHGLSALGVFIEIIASRLLIFSFFLIVVCVTAITGIFFFRVFAEKIIPAWATIALSTILIVLLQSFLLSLFTIFLYLTFQGQRKFIPSYHYNDYVRTVEKSEQL